MICSTEAPCWIPGLGFRWVQDTGRQCAIDDAEYAGKFEPFPGRDPLEVLAFWFDGPDAAETLAVTVEPEMPAPVPLDGAGAYLGGALIAALMIRAAWRWTPRLENLKGDSGWI